MRYLIILYTTLLLTVFTFGQADCNDAMFGCTIGSFTTNSSGSGSVNELPGGNNISNPYNNPGTAGNSGCLLSGELNPTWIILTVSTSGYLEFTLGTPGGNGFYDWALWPYYDANDPLSNSGGDACVEIQNNLLAPVACNYNASSVGYTGMVQQGNLPPGAYQGNFEHSFLVNPGDQFVLCFSNWTGLVGANVPIFTGTDINGNSGATNSANITCDPSSLSTAICLGDTANVTIDAGGIPNPTFTFLNDMGDVVNLNTGPNFDIVPSDTTEYFVVVAGGTLIDTVSVIINVAFPPTPNAGTDFAICTGATGNLNGNSSDPNNDVSWNYSGPGNVTFSPDNTTLNANISTNTPGTYVFQLSEDNGICPAETDEVTVVFENPTLTLQGIDVSCSGEDDGEIHVSSPSAVSYSFDNGNTWQNDSFLGGFATGSYDVCIKTINGCVACDNIVLLEGNEIFISVSNDTTICENGEATLIASVNSGSNFTYHWEHTTDTNSVQSVSPTEQSVYTVYAQNVGGCSSISKSITVSVFPPLAVTTNSTPVACPGDISTLTAVASGGNGGAYNYIWTDQNGVVVGNSAITTVIPTQSATYIVTVTDGCESSPTIGTTDVVFENLPSAFFSIVKDEDCAPASFQIMSGLNPNMVDEIYWSISDGQTFSLEDTIFVDIDKSGQYDVQMTIVTTDGCVISSTVNSALTVHPKPILDFTYTPNPLTILNANAKFQNFTVDGVFFNWNFEEGNPITSTLKNPTSLFPEGKTGEYEVELIATTKYNCTDTLMKTIIVSPEVIIFVPNTFTPDGDDYNDTWNLVIDGVDVYSVDIEVFNRWGEKIWESHDINVGWDGTYGVAGEKVPVGTYVWKVKASDLITDKKHEWQGHVTVLY